MYRKRCIASGSGKYCVMMFALYFVKDQTHLGPGSLGHTNDWEFGLMWTENNELTHASYSTHGHVYSKPIEELYSDGKKSKTVFMNSYKTPPTTILPASTRPHTLCVFLRKNRQLCT